MNSTIGTLIAQTIREQRSVAELRRLAQLVDRVEVHIKALAAAAAQAQLVMQPMQRGGHGCSERYHTLAHNLAEPAPEELAALRVVLRVNRIPASKE